jgi:formylglycine-generating enzyme required for sulfatase activity
VNTALNEVTARRMLGVIPLLMLPTEERDILALWRPLHRYDATRGYESARDGLLRALGLSAAPAAQPQSAHSTPTIPPAARYPVTVRLDALGYQGVNLNGAPASIPPMITIPAGPFLMGSDYIKDSAAHHTEMPQYWVEVDTFQIAKYPVTVAEYTLAVRAGAMREPPTSTHNGFLVAEYHTPNVKLHGETSSIISNIPWSASRWMTRRPTPPG